MPIRTLVAYYSMTGNTDRIANEICERLGGQVDSERILEPRERRGGPGILRAVLDAIIRRKPAIVPPKHKPGDYDLLILGGPVWTGRMASPVRTYASRHGPEAARVAFFCTEGGAGADSAFAELEKFCHREPSATLVVDQPHLPAALHSDSMARFVAAVRRM